RPAEAPVTTATSGESGMSSRFPPRPNRKPAFGPARLRRNKRTSHGARSSPFVASLRAPGGTGMKPGQSTLHPASHAAHEITHLWWVMMIGAWIGFAVVVLLLFL